MSKIIREGIYGLAHGATTAAIEIARLPMTVADAIVDAFSDDEEDE